MKPFLIIGGCGAVGTAVVKALGTFQPALPLVIAGRNLKKAQAAAAAWGNAIGVTVDTNRSDLGTSWINAQWHRSADQ